MTDLFTVINRLMPSVGLLAFDEGTVVVRIRPVTFK